MVVNLYVDHLMSRPPTSAEEVWNATQQHPALYSAAAKAVGLSDSDYREFRRRLLDGKAVMVKLPMRFDAMAASRRGYVYSIKNAQLVRPDWGWKVRLSDGNVVYIPHSCGNLAVRRQAVQFAALPPPFTPAIAPLPPQLVDVTPPAYVPAPPAVAALEAPGIAAVPIVPAAAGFCWYCFAPIAGLIPVITHHPSSPPCSGGSNATGVCAGK